jgi:hypothetical protein
MWPPFTNSIGQWARNCRIVHDKFHILWTYRYDGAMLRYRQSMAVTNSSLSRKRPKMGVPTNSCAEPKKVFFRCSDFGCGVGVLLGEALYAAGGVDQLLFAGEKRVAIRTDFNVELVALHRRSRGEIVAAGAVHGDGVVVRVDTGFHGRLHSVAAGLHGFLRGRTIQPRR